MPKSKEFHYIASVILASPGYVVIHEDAQGEPGDVIGVSQLLNAGDFADVTVELDTPVEKGDSVHVVLHADNGDLAFVADDDLAVNDEEGSMIIFSYLVGAGE